MQFQALRSGYYHCEFRLKSGFSALNVEEFLCAEVGTESGFGHHIVAISERHLGGYNRVTSVGNVGKGPAMHKCRIVLYGLHQIRVQGVLQEHRYCARHAEVIHGEWVALVGIAEQDFAHAAAQVVDVACEAQNSHNFAGWSDVESRLGWHAIHAGAKSGNHVAQVAVVNVEHAFPYHLAKAYAVFAVLIDIVIEEGCNHVVSRGDGMEVASEVEVDVLHRQHLRVSAAGSTAF